MINITKKQTYWVLGFCIIGSWVSILAIAYGLPVEEEKWEPKIMEPSVITITPLDSPNPCWDPNFWSKAE